MRKQNVVDSKCPHCGAKLDFDANTQKWLCKYCDSSFTLEEIENNNNAASIENNETPLEEISPNYDSYRCQNCGAEIIADEQTSATFCIYCGNTAILKNKLSGTFNPDWIIPFKKEEKDARTAFRNISKGRPLCPKGFNDEKNIEKIRGVYIPFWLFDFMSQGELDCDGINVRTWRVGDTQYTETKKYNLERAGSMHFTRIPRDGSTRFADDIMDSIEPFNYEELVKYNHAYLSGFLAEKYDVPAEEAAKDAGARANQSATNTMYNDMKTCSTKTIRNNTITSTETRREYVLLPVYMVNVNYGGKMYTFAMNGQTGEFIGDIPVDKKKACLYAIGIFLALFTLIIIGSYFINML